MEFQTFIEIVATVVGLLLGSFANVCIARMPEDESVVAPRSHCRSCGRTIAWYDNIPVLSFFLLRARCRYCGAHFSSRYPLVEALTGAWFLVIVHTLGLSWGAAKWCLFGFALIELIFSDLETRILPDEFTIGGWVVAVALSWFAPPDGGLIAALIDVRSTHWSGVAESAISSVALALVLWSVGWLYAKLRKRDGLGLGDVKLLGMMAAFLGLERTILALLGASLTGSVVGIVYIKARGLDSATYELPLGSFLGAAGLAAVLYALFGPPFGTGLF